jgi:phosphatidylinositol alpha-mannosyltransferase
MQLLRRQCQAIVDGIDVNIAVSEACIRAVQPYVHGEFRIIPNGVDCGEWSGGHRLSWARDQLNVLFIGRLEARNGLDRVLRAWPLLPKGLRANLLVLGDGPVRHQYEALAHELGVPARFFGSVREHRADYFASADVLVCPMTIASFGVTLLEGMAAGLPIIASDIDGFREILTHGREGWLIDSADASLFAARLSELLESPSLRSRLGDAGQRTAQRYDWPRVTEQILDVYREVGARA